jgi:hypothetical protein
MGGKPRVSGTCSGVRDAGINSERHEFSKEMNFQLAIQEVLKTLGAIGGIGAIVFGLSSWLGKIWADRLSTADRAKYSADLEELKTSYEAANRRLQAELDKRVHVHQVQFETEFKALSEIWDKVVALESLCVTSWQTPVIPVTCSADDPPPLATWTEWQNSIKRFTELRDAARAQFENLQKALLVKRPFYAEEVFNAAQSVLRTGAKVLEDSVPQHPQKLNKWLDTCSQNVEQFRLASVYLSDAIRTRLSKLSVQAD